VKPRYALLISILFFTVAGMMSCNTLPGTSNESWYTYEKEKRRERRSIGKIRLIGVSVYRAGGWDSIQSEIKGLAPLLFWKHRLYLVSDDADADYAADIRLHEREYMSQWRTKRSLALEVRIWEMPSEIPGGTAFSFDDRLPLAVGRVIGSGNHSFSSLRTSGRMLSHAVKIAVKRMYSLKKSGEKKAETGKVSELEVLPDEDSMPQNHLNEEQEYEIEYQVDDE